MSNSRASSYRWVVLTVFTVIAGVSQMLWLNFAPLITKITKVYNVSEDQAVFLLIAVFPLLYVVLSLPAGSMIDRKGYKFTVSLAAIVMAVFACVRIFTEKFAFLFIGQLGIAAAQPFVINGVSKLVADWFDEDQTAIATGLATLGMFLGMAIAMALTPVLENAWGLRNTMVFFAGISIVSAVAFLVLCKETRLAKPDMAASSWGDIKALLSNRNIILLSIVSFLALGFFNGLTTLLEPILKPLGINAEDAGLVGGVLIIGGILGAAIIPAISDKIGRRKPFLLVCAIAGAVIVYPLCTNPALTVLLPLAAVLGFLFLPGYALLLTMAEETAGAEKAGVAAAVIMLVGNAGGVVVIVAMEALKTPPDDWLNSIFLMIGLMVVTGVTTFLVKETFRK